MNKEPITIDDLARMVQDGFTESKNSMQEQFAQVHHELKAIRKELLGVVYRPEFEDLQEQVRELQDILSVLKKKAA